MALEKSVPAKYPICQNVRCTKYSQSDRIFWKRELDHQYQFYLATLRAQQDAKYIIQEHSDLLRQIALAETSNVELRKEIRLLKTELYTMCQRNAHDSCVIDGLQEADHEWGETEILDSQTCHKINIATAEGDQEDSLNGMIKEEIFLLRKKDVEDAEFIASLQPLEAQLKKTLEVEKMQNHQQNMKFKRELEEVLKAFQQRNSNLERIKTQKSSEIAWIGEIFPSIFGSRMVDSDVTSSTDDASSLDKYSLQTDSFNISPQIDILNVANTKDDLEVMKFGCNEFVALKEFMDLKNAVNLRVIYDCIQRFTEGVKELMEEYIFLFEVSADIEFIKEYLGRLDIMRKKQDIVKDDQNSVQNVHRLEQQTLIYNSLLTEKEFIVNSMHFFMSTLKEDFETHCVILRKTEELFNIPPSEQK